MTGIAIRCAEAEDTERLNEALSYLSGEIGDDHGGTAELLRKAGFGHYPAFRALLAEDGEAVVGAALYSPVFSTVRAGAGVYVSDLWVSGAARGQGLGKRLLQAVAADAQAVWDARFLKLVVYDDNEAARGFYNRLGFVASVGETTLTLNDRGLSALKDE
ncbi:N-acetyltransferase family protein [Oricola sp.]|uniref:GNAT family N-acetyltransferase n=1 Tax=Oricola sp. TaxID=1979950 RepID=UPI0035130ECD